MSTRPRVLHVYKDYFPPVLGGIETTINLMARGTARNYDASVLVCSGSTRRIDEVLEGVHVTRIPELRRFASAPLSPTFPAELRKAALNADIIHVHHPNPTGDIACLLARPSQPIVMTYHSDVVRQKRAMLLYGPIQERMMRRCQVIMPTSQNYLESSTWLQRHRDKCTVIPLGIDLSRFYRDDVRNTEAAQIRQKYAGPLTIFVGRLRYYKGLHFLIRAMESVPGTLLVGGTGPEEENLRQLAAQRGVRDRIVFLGDLSEEQLVTNLMAADAFCMPSHLRSEAFGISQIEAMACGLPVVSTRLNTGVPFVNCDRESGLTVTPGSPQELSSALNQLYRDQNLRDKLAAGALLRAQQLFSSQQMCMQLEEVYTGVLSQQLRATPRKSE